jgi:hypothetical protein
MTDTEDTAIEAVANTVAAALHGADRLPRCNLERNEQ